MQNKLNRRIRWLVAATFCGLWLAGGSLPAQDVSEVATNPVAGITKPAKDNLRGGPLVVIGKDAELKADETADAVVVIGGNAVVRGKVRDAAVAIGGNVTIYGEVGDAVAVMGRVRLETNAVVRGDAVSVGGNVDVTKGAVLKGEKVGVDFGAIGLPRIEWLRKWFVQCALKLRPLAPHVGWVWAVAGGFFLLYLLAAVAIPKPVQACVGELTRRPATTFFMGLLVKLLLAPVVLILAATGVGLFVVPFVFAALFFGKIIGKAAFLEYLGFGVQKAFGVGEAAKPIIALVIGAIIITVLYLVPVLGLLTFAVTGMWGLGAAATAAFGSLKRERPGKTTPSPTAPPVHVTASGLTPVTVATPAVGIPPGDSPPPASTPAPPIAPAPSVGADAAPEAERGATAGTASPPASSPGATAALPDALAYPRASFWERMGAAFLDVVLVGVVSGLANAAGGPSWGPLIALAYFAGMWTWKGTTVGGIVLNLKVVRLDGSPMTFAAALVRGLAAAFSVIVFFLGFLWIIWDPEKQGWHDRIAGTVVVRLPRGLPLVCL
jgi:uncharacterized RDD family membrane protein YckC